MYYLSDHSFIVPKWEFGYDPNMVENINENLRELENYKKILRSLCFGKDNAEIVLLGCKCLNLLLILHDQLAGKEAELALIEENFKTLYYFVFKTMDLGCAESVEKSLPLASLKPYGAFLNEIHLLFAIKAKEKKLYPLVDFHLKKAQQFYPAGVQYHPSEQVILALAESYIGNNEFKSALECLNSYQGVASTHLLYKKLFCLNKLCDFAQIEKELPAIKGFLDLGDEKASPLLFQYVGMDNQTVFEVSKNFQKKFEGRQDFVFKGSREKGRKIRLAYIGSNFIPHAQSLQFGSSFFKDHGERFEIFIYSLRGDGTSSSEKLIKGQVAHYVDALGMLDDTIVEMIRNDNIDIIVNCNGHADEFRPYAILSRRVAPIQIDYLGYPGSSGASYIDYYIGDTVSSPIDLFARFFTEKLILLPHTYQVTEHAEVYAQLPEGKLTPNEAREEVLKLIRGNREALLKRGVSEQKIDELFPPGEWVKGRFIFCSLNNHNKLSIKDIRCWNEILKRVANSVLILYLHQTDEAKGNLIKLFDEEVRERVYFIVRVPKWLHMQRLRGVDLVLDSFYYGAHTTAGDAIWAHVPIATCLGESMQTRVCAGMLQAAGLQELVAKDRQGYIDFAIRCATDPVYYKEVREKFKDVRRSPLFDRPLYMRNLTKAYLSVWERFCEGKPPEHITLENIA